MVFRPKAPRVEWITLALQTLTHKHRNLRRITVDISYSSGQHPVDGSLRQALGEETVEQWLDLDRTLVHLWEPYPILVKVRWSRDRQKKTLADYVWDLCPETMRRGLVSVDWFELG